MIFMNILRKLIVHNRFGNHTILFGEAITDAEIKEVFKLRYQVYSERDYIEVSKYPNQLETDEYDLSGKSHYFTAIIEENNYCKIIGCIRVIVDDPLPTELDFEFSEPAEMRSIPRDRRFEIGRFIIIPPDKNNGKYLPRGVVRLFLLDLIGDYGIKHNLIGGYAFIKQTLDQKLKKFGFPVGYIKAYRQVYPENGVLYKYFTQKNDPVIPIYFISKQCFDFTQKAIHRQSMFEICDEDTYIFKDNILNNVLKVIKIV